MANLVKNAIIHHDLVLLRNMLNIFDIRFGSYVYVIYRTWNLVGDVKDLKSLEYFVSF